MDALKINIVSFNIPYPPNYGGIIDVFYKIKSLHATGIKIILHCFDYGRGIQPELDKLCEKVYYYKRKTGFLNSVGKTPYIIKSRSNAQLLNNLNKNSYPILFEGLHTTYYLSSNVLKKRIKVVRMHNIEHDYYLQLAKQEKNVFKKLYFKNAANKLKKYEQTLKYATHIAAISPNDYAYFAKLYKNTFWLPPFHPNNGINITFGTSSYVIYHANLSVPENIEAAKYLINAFYNINNISLVIAGKNPDKHILKLAQNAKHIKIVANPSESEMQNLVAMAHVHLLPTFQPTGIKLKLIASLFNGRHCVVNNDMISGTGLESLCHLANTPNEFVDKTKKLMDLPFENKDLIHRKQILSNKFDNKINAELLLSKIVE